MRGPRPASPAFRRTDPSAPATASGTDGPPAVTRMDRYGAPAAQPCVPSPTTTSTAIGIAGSPPGSCRALVRQRRMALDADHPRAQLGQDRRLVARSGAHLEHRARCQPSCQGAPPRSSSPRRTAARSSGPIRPAGRGRRTVVALDERVALDRAERGSSSGSRSLAPRAARRPSAPGHGRIGRLPGGGSAAAVPLEPRPPHRSGRVMSPVRSAGSGAGAGARPGGLPPDGLRGRRRSCPAGSVSAGGSSSVPAMSAAPWRFEVGVLVVSGALAVAASSTSLRSRSAFSRSIRRVSSPLRGARSTPSGQPDEEESDRDSHAAEHGR